MSAEIQKILDQGVGEMEQFRATIRGLAPGMLMHSAAVMALQEEWKAKEGKGRKKVIPTPEQEAEWGVYRDPETKTLVLPSLNLQRAMIEAGKMFTSQERKRASAARDVAAGVHIPEGIEWFHLVHPETGEAITDYEIDVRRAVVMRAAVMRARPRIREWSCEVVMQLDTASLGPEMALRVLMMAGRQIGVGDYRPERTGPFGRFVVENFDAEAI